MGLFSRKKEQSLGELLRSAEVPKAQLEQKIEERPAREIGTELRRQAADSIRGAWNKLGESGRNLWGGLKRIWGTGKEKGIEAIDIAIGGTVKGGKAAGRGIEIGAAVVAQTPDWLIDQVGEGLYAGTEGAKAAGRFIGEKGKQAAVYATEKAGEGAAWMGGKLVEGAGWMEAKFDQAKGWTEAKYNSLEQWAGERVAAIQEKARLARDGFNERVGQVKEWRDAQVTAFKEAKRREEVLKLTMELQAMESRRKAIQERLAELEGIGHLQTQLETAGV